MEGNGTKSETMLPATITKTKGVCTLCVLILLGRSVFFPLECIQAFSPRQKSGLSKYTPRFAAQEREKGLEESSLPICYDPTFVRYRCRIAYDGTSFSGFQLQGGRETPNKNNPRTIQGELERVLSTRFQRVVKVVGAGRTDGGVHARGQAIHFDLYPNETSSSHHEFETDLERTMNRMLPSDIRAWRVGRTIPSPVLDVSPQGIYNWNAMRTSVSKLYSYRICVGDAMDPSERHHRWQLPWRGIDPRKLERVLADFEGEHDFVCFAGALEQRQKKTGIAMGTVRTIHKVRLVRESSSSTRNNYGNNMGGDLSQDYYRIDIYLDGALYKMVRNIVGTAIDVCRDWMEEDRLLDLLNRPGDLNLTRKDNPCMPAPPNGLTLERVFYPDDEQF